MVVNKAQKKDRMNKLMAFFLFSQFLLFFSGVEFSAAIFCSAHSRGHRWQGALGFGLWVSERHFRRKSSSQNGSPQSFVTFFPFPGGFQRSTN